MPRPIILSLRDACPGEDLRAEAVRGGAHVGVLGVDTGRDAVKEAPLRGVPATIKLYQRGGPEGGEHTRAAPAEAKLPDDRSRRVEQQSGILAGLLVGLLQRDTLPGPVVKLAVEGDKGAIRDTTVTIRCHADILSGGPPLFAGGARESVADLCETAKLLLRGSLPAGSARDLPDLWQARRAAW